MELILTIEKLIWFSAAALGFAILFNVPPRTLPIIAIMGLACGAVKFLIIGLGGGLILASFIAAMVTGMISIWASHTKHSPPLVFAIPTVIPLVPGKFAYSMMIGLIKLAGDPDHEKYTSLLNHTINDGLKTFFIVMALSVGVSGPMLLARRVTAKDFRLPDLIPKEKTSRKGA